MTKKQKKKDLEQICSHIIGCLVKLNKKEREQVFWAIDNCFCVICGSKRGAECDCLGEAFY